MPAIQPAITTLLLHVANANAEDPTAMELAIGHAWTATKVIFACSPILAIFAVLALAREDEETENAKRKIKESKK